MLSNNFSPSQNFNPAAASVRGKWAGDISALNSQISSLAQVSSLESAQFVLSI